MNVKMFGNSAQPLAVHIYVSDIADAKEIAWALQKVLKKKNRQRRAQGGSSIGYDIRIMNDAK